MLTWVVETLLFDIIVFSFFYLDLKKAPYLRADAARRNRRKTQELMKQISRDVLAGVTNGTTTNSNNAPEVHL